MNKMKRISNLIVILLMITSAVVAQNKKNFTLEDLMPGGDNYYSLQVENLHGLTWWGDICIKPDMDEVKAIEVAALHFEYRPTLLSGSVGAYAARYYLFGTSSTS